MNAASRVVNMYKHSIAQYCKTLIMLPVIVYSSPMRKDAPQAAPFDAVLISRIVVGRR